MKFRSGDRVIVQADSRWNSWAGIVTAVRNKQQYPYEVLLDEYGDEDLRYWFPEYELRKEEE